MGSAQECGFLGRCKIMVYTIQLSDGDVNMLIGGLLCRVNQGYTTGEDHGVLLSKLKNMVGIEW